MTVSFRSLAFVFPLVALAACGSKPSANVSINSLDADLAAQASNAALPALGQPHPGATQRDSSTLTQRAHHPAVAGARPRTSDRATPSRQCAQCSDTSQPTVLRALANRRPVERSGPCARTLEYSNAWARRLPADLPLYPDALVDEAAGSAGGCALRVVSFSTRASVQTVVDWYYRRLTTAGYAPERQTNAGQSVVGGVRAKDGAACVIYVNKRSNRRTHVDLVANKGN